MIIPIVPQDFPRHVHPNPQKSTESTSWLREKTLRSAGTTFSPRHRGSVFSLAASARSANSCRKAQLTTKRNQPQQGKGLGMAVFGSFHSFP